MLVFCGDLSKPPLPRRRDVRQCPLCRRRREHAGRGFDSSGGNGGGEPSCCARHRMRACGRHLLGLLGHVRPAAHERLRRSRHVDHLRAHGYRRRVLPVPYRGAQLARSRSGVPRLALARADRGVRHIRRAVDPAQLLERHLVHECRRGHYHRAGGARAHHAVRVRSRQALSLIHI